MQILLEDAEHHSYLPSSIFISENDEQGPDVQAVLFCATAKNSDVLNKRPWSEIKKVIDKVHKYVCSHPSLSDMEALPKRNELWFNVFEKYLCRIVSSCTGCAKAYEPKQARQVSLSALNRSFNDLVCIHIFHLGNLRIFPFNGCND